MTIFRCDKSQLEISAAQSNQIDQIQRKKRP